MENAIVSDRKRQWRLRNPDKVKESSRRAREKGKAQRKEYMRLYYLANKERVRKVAKAWRSGNPNKAALSRLQWRQNNPGHAGYLVAKRRALKKNATPKWLTAEQKQEIKSLYRRAKLEGKQVDHIVPLSHKRVCGLHVPWNLQLLTKAANTKKGNKLLY